MAKSSVESQVKRQELLGGHREIFGIVIVENERGKQHKWHTWHTWVGPGAVDI